VLDKTTENTVFRRYNTAVVVAFIIIVFIALAAASLRYYSELSVHKQRSLEQLIVQSEQLNSMLVQSEQATLGIQDFAQYALKYPDELYSKVPPLRQDGALFFLDIPTRSSFSEDKRISGNITGFGDIDKFSLLKQQEIAMANALTPAFVAAQKVIPEANWFYYVSGEQFVNIFPWIGRDSWRFSDRILTNEHTKKIEVLGEKNNKVVWSSPYLDVDGTGRNVSLGLGVYRDTKMLGAVVIDISLARLQKSLSELTSKQQSLVLLNKQNDILIFKKKDEEPLNAKVSWQTLLPKSLHFLKDERLAQLSDSTKIDGWFVEKQSLAINGWTLLKYQPYDSFISPLRSHFIFMFTILLIGLFAFLMLVNAMTRRSFIRPTHDFISHIEFCAQGDPGKVKANADWLHWFVLVEDIFTQNRSLLLQLKEQNGVLDSRVLEKTRALLETSIQHQRDYVLLRSVMNAIPELIIFNDPDGKIIGCNQSFEQLTEYSESAMLGLKATQFMPEALANAIDKLNEKFSLQYPQQALLEAGEESYQGYCNQFSNEQGEVLGTITILQNVTEQQATQSALEKAKDQAEYANKVKIQFLANMSHEIRTPINAIQGMMSLLTGTILDSRQQHYLTNAQTASFSLLHLIDELLDLSKIEAGKMVVIKDVMDLPAVIDKALKLNAANIYMKKLTMWVELAVDVPRFLMSDEMRLVQVISNLLNNAIKFTEQGEINLLIDSIDLNDTNALIRFKVRDTGIGIAKENQGHLFEAFSQADISMTRKYGGSGLGLSICQQIVNLLGGEITLESNLGEGCEFSFILPFSLPNEEMIKQSDSHSRANNENSNIHIYVINQVLSVSFIQTIKSLSWCCYQVDNFDELNQVLVDNKSPTDKTILLMDEETFSKYKINDNLANTIDLIGLCQPATCELEQKTCQQLDSIKVPYILLDTPLYRYSLAEIDKALFNTLEDNTKLTLTNELITPHKQPLLQEPLQREGQNKLTNIKVLLVEDNLVNQLVAKELLLSMKATVVIAENGQKALDALEEQVFDVVLMDIQMPVMDGLTAVTAIRQKEKYKHLPIIAMTAHAREEDKQRSLAVGMNLHIAKPVTADLLLMSIVEVLRLT
jgi:PAS domain S-box-containing protein